MPNVFRFRKFIKFYLYADFYKYELRLEKELIISNITFGK